jgi:hypothetical protein
MCVSQFFEFLKNCHQFWFFKYLQNQRTVGSGSLEKTSSGLPTISGFHERTNGSSVGSSTFEFLRTTIIHQNWVFENFEN